MLDFFDFKEPSCKLCDGKSFYYPDKDAPIGRIPVSRIIEKLDACYNKNDYAEAGRLLFYWHNEAKNLLDKQGELSIVNELLGHLRKVNDKENGLKAVARADELINLLELGDTLSSATIYLNMATTLKAFNQPQKALSIYDKAYSLYTKFGDKSIPYLAGFYNNKALTLVDLLDYNGAEECYQNALKYLKGTPNELSDGAITYVNLAHLYDKMQDRKKVTDCLFTAFNLLTDDSINQNGYYAYVLEKCAPSFSQFGYDKIASDFIKLSGEIYERT